MKNKGGFFMKFMSKTLPVVVSAAVALTSVPAFAAQSDTGIEINGQSVTFTDVTPYEEMAHCIFLMQL